MNLALVIGVSNYGGSNDLPACKIDAEIVSDVLSRTGKFENVLYISDNTTANGVKDRLVRFVEDHKGQVIDELFFYFTGHGEYFENEFFYLMSDYNSGKRKSTSLQNSELDNLLRALSPKLAIKFVDACNAGVTYVKEEGAFEKYIKQTQSTFNNCYFMFSSQQKQFSYQDDKFSDFTKSFLMSIKEHTMPYIRYKNIIDYVSDYFEGNAQQTPLFITQADFTETFCEISKELQAFLSERLEDASTPPVGEKASLVTSIESHVKREALIYCTKDEAVSIVTTLPEIMQRFQPDDTLDYLYTYVYNTDLNTEKLPSISSVGQWFKENKSNFFARPTYATETYEDYDDDYSRLGIAAFAMGRGDRKKVTKQRKVIVGIELTETLPYNHIELVANPKYPNIDAYALHVVFVLSKTDIRLFYFISNYIETGWDKRTLNNDIKWQTACAKLKEQSELEVIVSDMMDEFKHKIIEFVQEKFPESQTGASQHTE